MTKKCLRKVIMMEVRGMLTNKRVSRQRFSLKGKRRAGIHAGNGVCLR